ncbi:hypothetical protein BDV98DRAFT_574946 [Pterulicium gracile]|uniref:Uncharacterized protein n=1 Tax=Pterulicium gracile TaxID=1884261 RepID=A0A5C3Q5P2_9AGAR|nr:hypothetical protein BDV98DRAFT_574946 [Pterula gracilis]
MKFIALSTVLSSLLSLSLATTNTVDTSLCTIDTDAAPTYIGVNKDVLVQSASCPPTVAQTPAVAEFRAGTLQARQTNVCGAQCATNCFAGTANGPTAGDCSVIASAILYESQSVGPLFTVGPAPGAPSQPNTLVMSFRNCQTFYLNQSNASQTYCRTAWSDLVNWLNTECSATKGRHGGNCVATNQAWFVQVQKP